MKQPTYPEVQKKKPGRRPGVPIRYNGASIFARERGVTYQHVYRVLKGERESIPLLIHFGEWLDRQGLPWPTQAVPRPRPTPAQ